MAAIVDQKVYTFQIPQHKCVTICPTRLGKSSLPNREDLVSYLSSITMVSQPEITETETEWLLGEHIIVDRTDVFQYLPCSIDPYVDCWQLILPDGNGLYRFGVISHVLEIVTDNKERTPINEIILVDNNERETIVSVSTESPLCMRDYPGYRVNPRTIDGILVKFRTTRRN